MLRVLFQMDNVISSLRMPLTKAMQELATIRLTLASLKADIREMRDDSRPATTVKGNY